MIGKVVINANGEKAISFDDAAWAALPVGATIYAAGFEDVQDFKACGRTVGHGASCAIGWLCGSCEKLLEKQKQLNALALGWAILEKDATRYRKWRYGATARCVETAKALCYAGTPEQIDEAIDALGWER